MKQKEIDVLRDLAKLVTDEDSTVQISKKALNELVNKPSLLEFAILLGTVLFVGFVAGTMIGSSLH